LLHQAVVEVVTLRDPPILNLSFDLGHVTYPPDVLASISNTTITYCDIKKQIVLRHERDGELKILEAMRQRIFAITPLKNIEGEAKAKAKVKAAVKLEAKPSDLSRNPNGAPDKSPNNRQMMVTSVTAQDIVNEPALPLNFNIQSNQGSKGGIKEGILPQKCVSAAELLPLFAKLPLKTLAFRFAVSPLDSDYSDCANSMLIRSSSGYPS
jgi:hypothetical protein